jgi:hypothetical protein
VLRFWSPPLPEEPHPWRLIIDALIEVARTALPDEWTRYGMIASELLGLAPPAAARRRLWQARAHKLLEAEDYGFLDQVLRPARATPPVSHHTRLAKEALCLEERLEAALVDELRAGRWEGEATSARDGHAFTIGATTWHVIGLTFDLLNSAVQPGAAPRLLGVRLRRAAPQPVAAGEKEPAGTTPGNKTADDLPSPPGGRDASETEPAARVPSLDEGIEELIDRQGLNPPRDGIAGNIKWGPFEQRLRQFCKVTPKDTWFILKTIQRHVRAFREKRNHTPET